jgi:hypothetical protein
MRENGTSNLMITPRVGIYMLIIERRWTKSSTLQSFADLVGLLTANLFHYEITSHCCSLGRPSC